MVVVVVLVLEMVVCGSCGDCGNCGGVGGDVCSFIVIFSYWKLRMVTILLLIVPDSDVEASGCRVLGS